MLTGTVGWCSEPYDRNLRRLLRKLSAMAGRDPCVPHSGRDNLDSRRGSGIPRGVGRLMTSANKSRGPSIRTLSRGEKIDLAERLLVEAGIVSAVPSVVGDCLPACEAEALAAVGLRRNSQTQRKAQRARLRYACTLLDLFAASDLPEAIARRLGVSPRTVQKRISEGSLLSVEIDGVQRVPRFQFEGNLEVPGLRKVLATVGREISPVAFAMWFLNSIEDLAWGAEEAPLSPREWLLRGGALTAVTEQCRELR